MSQQRDAGVRFSLNVKIVGVLMLCMVIPMIAVGTYFYTSLERDLGYVEEERLRGYSASSANLLAQMGEDALNVAKSYSYWEDFRGAIPAGDMAWIEENVLTVADVISKVHFAAVAKLDGTIIGTVGDEAAFPDRAVDALVMGRFGASPDFSGLTLVQGKLAIVAVSGVTNEDASKERTGVLVFGRYVDDEAVAQLERVLQAGVAIASTEGAMAGLRRRRWRGAEARRADGRRGRAGGRGAGGNSRGRYAYGGRA
ncbi:hypothetical protein MO973_21440 [Paenibacillus sp. TRM 82003]|nr:hypothetical protein [Paenibacillus sp. TRM 82003]